MGTSYKSALSPTLVISDAYRACLPEEDVLSQSSNHFGMLVAVYLMVIPSRLAIVRQRSDHLLVNPQPVEDRVVFVIRPTKQDRPIVIAGIGIRRRVVAQVINGAAGRTLQARGEVLPHRRGWHVRFEGVSVRRRTQLTEVFV